MRRAGEILRRYRVVGLAVAVSALVHAVVMVGMPRRIDAIDDRAAAVYAATLEGAAASLSPEATPAPAPAAPRPARPPRPKKARPASPAPPPPADIAAEPAAEEALVAAAPPTAVEAAPAPPPKEEPPAPAVVADSIPSVPVPELEPEKFPVAALPREISIAYQLTSAFADGRATYQWSRDGDHYKITGEAAAEGFFTLFLDGMIVQESRGTVTPGGLRPDRFSENRPGSPPEGLEFDWAGRKVTFDRKGERKTSDLAANTVDWLSMIFQLAHVPPTQGDLELRVFTQRKLYSFKLTVLGEETIDIPLGKVRALHLRHVDPQDGKETVDVWLGIDQHYLPVKLRYPVARNRLTVEQVATRVTTE
ncbi:MAG TPA: DUF3108 domain-containing protein [Usitatibacter sp.]|nr:DUF3108 domain-containing protein [Usitatibacter sp.]